MMMITMISKIIKMIIANKYKKYIQIIINAHDNRFKTKLNDVASHCYKIHHLKIDRFENKSTSTTMNNVYC